MEQKVHATILLGNVLFIAKRVEDRYLGENENDHDAIQYL